MALAMPTHPLCNRLAPALSRGPAGKETELAKRVCVFYKKNPAAGGAGGGVLTGGPQRRADVLTEPSVKTKMTRRPEKWCVAGYRTS